MRKILAAALVSLLPVAPAFANAVQCNATIGAVLVYSDGSVNVLHSGRGDYTFICNLQNDWKGVKPSTCAMWTSLLQAQKRAAKPAQFYYYSGGAFSSCADIPSYSNAVPPVYIGAMD